MMWLGLQVKEKRTVAGYKIPGAGGISIHKLWCVFAKPRVGLGPKKSGSGIAYPQMAQDSGLLP
jgi:hypothetical protein